VEEVKQRILALLDLDPIPQRLEPLKLAKSYGGAEAPPLQSRAEARPFQGQAKARPFPNTGEEDSEQAMSYSGTEVRPLQMTEK
jgi:hypothetical protein